MRMSSRRSARSQRGHRTAHPSTVARYGYVFGTSPSAFTSATNAALKLGGVAFLLAACVTSADQSRWSDSMRREPLDGGISRTFPASLDETLRAAEDAFVAVGLRQGQDCAAPDRRSGEVTPRCTERAVTTVGDRARSIVGYNQGRAWNGVQVRIVVHQAAATQTTVWVISKYRMDTIVGGRGDYSERILSEIARTLARTPAS